jgi:hypothetical protein
MGESSVHRRVDSAGCHPDHLDAGNVTGLELEDAGESELAQLSVT